jgi:predicted Zn-dependent peptidase
MEVKRKVLENGLRVVAVPLKGNPTTTVLVLVEAGSHYETKHNNGVSHFLEHLCFKGTSNRPSPIAIAHELDALGAQSNAFTSYEMTGYWAKARSGNFRKIFDVVADLYLHPTVDKAELEKEKGVIVEEINMYKDLPMREVGRLLDRVMYGAQPAGLSILGPKENIRAMTREDFVRYRNEHYVPQATTVVVAGGVEAGEVFKTVERYFGTLPKGKKSAKKRVRDTQKAPQVGVEHKKSSQCHFQLGFRGLPVGHKSTPVVEVLIAVLGKGMSSRLFKKLREEMGVCYYVRAAAEYNTDHGKVVIASGVDNTRIKTVLEAIRDELKIIKAGLVEERELSKAKEFLIGNLLMDLESSDEAAEYFGEQEILRQKLQTPAEHIKKVRTISAKEVQAMARKLFVSKNANLALIGPFKNAEPFKKLLKF